MIRAALEQLDGKPDVIINNFGINNLSWIGTTEDIDEDIIHANLLGPYWVVNHTKAIWGDSCRVLNISSQTYRVPQRCTSLYCASKAGLVHMTKVMARELAPRGWIINAVCPGKISDTYMSQKIDAQVLKLRNWDEEEAYDYALSGIPMDRFTTRAEVAEVVMRVLAMPSYVNGAIFDVMGGV